MVHFADLPQVLSNLKSLTLLYWAALIGYLISPGVLWLIILIFSRTYRITLTHDYLAERMHQFPDLSEGLKPQLQKAKSLIWAGIVSAISLAIQSSYSFTNLWAFIPSFILFIVFFFQEETFNRCLLLSTRQSDSPTAS
jgi:hypothetical protein